MEYAANTTARRLVHAFMQFHRAEWHPPSVAGCTPGEVRILFSLRRCAKSGVAEMKVSEISRLLRVTSPTITQMLKSLEAHQLIERQSDPEDRRVVYVRLTEQGDLITQQAAEALGSSVRGLVTYLGEEKSSQLADLLFETSRYFHEKAGGDHRPPWNGELEA